MSPYGPKPTWQAGLPTSALWGRADPGQGELGFLLQYERDLRERQSAAPHWADAPFGTRGALIDCFFRCQCGGTSIMTWKLALLVLASAAMLASTPASARFYRHSH